MHAEKNFIIARGWGASKVGHEVEVTEKQLQNNSKAAGGYSHTSCSFWGGKETTICPGEPPRKWGKPLNGTPGKRPGAGQGTPDKRRKSKMVQVPNIKMVQDTSIRAFFARERPRIERRTLEKHLQVRNFPQKTEAANAEGPKNPP